MHKRRAAHLKSPRFDQLDAVQNVFFAEQLWQIKARTYDKKYPKLKARQFIPMATEIDPTTDVLKIRSYSQVGVAQLIQSYADDLPRADVLAEEMTVEFKSLGDSYGYDVMEIRKASRAGFDLPASKAAAARRAIEIKIDMVLAFGDDATGLVGLLNQPNAQTFVVPVGGQGSTTWAQKNGEEIAADLIGIVEQIIDVTNESESPNMILVPRQQFVLLSQRRYDPDADNTTVLEWFRAAYPDVGIDQWNKLKGIGAGGTDRMVAYSMDPDHLEGAVPQEFEQLPGQARNLEIVVPCHARVGGVWLYYPLSMAYGDGV